MADVTRDEIEAIGDRLDAEVRLRIKSGLEAGISGATAQNVWSVLRTTFRETVSARDQSMRLRTTDPTAGHKPPLKTSKRHKTFLYPVEFARLVACAEVPREWRQAYAVAAYLYVRPEELEALTWADCDLAAGTVDVNKAVNARNGKPGITWLALSGLDVAKIQRRAGHEDLETTLCYVKLAEDLTGTIGTPFSPLPDDLVESSRIVHGRFRTAKMPVKVPVFGAGGGNRTPDLARMKRPL